MKKRFELIAFVAVLLTAGTILAPAQAQVIEPGDSEFFEFPQGFSRALNCGLFTDGRFCKASNEGANKELVLISLESPGVFVDWNGVATLHEDFTVSPTASGEERSVGVTVAGGATWLGELIAVGVGSDADVTITVELFDRTTGTVVGAVGILSEAVSSGLSGGSFRTLNNSGTVSFNADVIRGHDYRLRLNVNCSVRADLGDAACIMGKPTGIPLFPDNFVRWDGFTVTLEVDNTELLLGIQESIDALQKDIDQLKEWQLEVLRLLHTPQGLRDTDVPACEGEACDFPENSRRRESGNN